MPSPLDQGGGQVLVEGEGGDGDACHPLSQPPTYQQTSFHRDPLPLIHNPHTLQ